MGGDRGARGARHRPRLQVPARSRRRHGDDRQAARFCGRIRSRLRHRRPHSRRRSRPRRPLRLFRRCQHRRCRSRHVPLRQRVFPAGIENQYAPHQDQHGVEYRVSRFRRPAGNDGDRARDRRDRLESRPRSARCPQGQSLQPRPGRHAVRANRRGPGHCAAVDRSARTLVQLSAAPQRDQRIQRSLADPEKRDRADAGEVRHFVHAHAPQSGWRAGARLSGRVGASQSRRHRNGPGPVSESRPGGGRGIRHRARSRAHHRHIH